MIRRADASLDPGVQEAALADWGAEAGERLEALVIRRTWQTVRFGEQARALHASA